jgi:hypothetical protein
MLAIFSLDSSCLETGDIASGKCLSDGKTDQFFTRKDFRYHFGNNFWLSEVQDGWQANDGASQEALGIMRIVRGCIAGA